MGNIDWTPITELPDALMDGREVMFWTDDQVVIAFWDTFLDGDDDEYQDWATREGGHLTGATHFAEINSPA